MNGDIEQRIAALEVAARELDSPYLGSLPDADRLGLLRRIEVVARMLPAIGHQLIDRLTPDTLADTLRITRSDARRRIADAEDLGLRTAITGQPLEPEYPDTAAAQRHGAIGREHVKVVRDFFHHLPAALDHATRMQAERQLAELAATLRPDELRVCADRLAAYLNPDGEFDDRDRARKRCLHLGNQGADKMSTISGLVDPELRSYLEIVFAKLAKPGMCNPDEQVPYADVEPSTEVAQSDSRSAGQRRHDAMTAMARATLASGTLAQHRGLPATVIVTASLRELESGEGSAVTGGGSMLPMRDVIRVARHAHHYLAIFDDDGRPLHLGRSRRIASADQRIMLHAADRGCTYPGCAVPGYLCEAHHVAEWADGGATDIDTLTFACPGHHRLISETGWRTVKSRTGRTQWIPPEHIDPRRQPRTNTYHHPERRVAESGDDEAA